MNGVVTTFGGTDRPGNAGIVRASGESVVGPFAKRGADGVDGREVNHVEAHRGDSGEPFGCSLERTGRPGPVVVLDCAFRAREELVPRPVQRPLAFDQQGERALDSDQVAQWVTFQNCRNLWVEGGSKPGFGRAAPITDRTRGGAQS